MVHKTVQFVQKIVKIIGSATVSKVLWTCRDNRIHSCDSAMTPIIEMPVVLRHQNNNLPSCVAIKNILKVFFAWFPLVPWKAKNDNNNKAVAILN